MAMSEKHRHAMYEHFLPQLGEEVTEAMMSHYPARDVEEPVTKEFLKGETLLVRMELREEMTSLREELHEEMTSLREELHEEMTSLREELHGEMAGLRDELRGEMAILRSDITSELQTRISGVDTRIDSLGATIDARMRQQFLWLLGVMVATITSMIAVLVTVLVRVR